jgi:hypothetical protein
MIFVRYVVKRRKYYLGYLSTNMISNEIYLNYEVVGLKESYNYRINLIFIRVHMKSCFF